MANERTMTGKMKDGTPVTIQFTDHGDTMPGFDEKGERFEAYSSHFKSSSFEFFNQLRKPLVDADPQIRMVEDNAALDSFGVDVSTLEITT